MPSLATARTINAAFSASYRPTAVFVGGTSGVGEGTASAFARATKGNAHIIIVGRSKFNADRIIADFPKTETSQYEFVESDVSLIKNVVKAATDIKSRLNGSLNYLILSQGLLNMEGFKPTTEGIDQKLALSFYSRWKFVDELMPYLDKAAAEGQEARVLTVLAAGQGGPLDTEDLGLKKNMTFQRNLAQSPTYNDIMVEEYAKRYPFISFIHIFPGGVATGIYDNVHWALRPFVPIVKLLLTSPKDCGEWMASALLSPDYKQGAFHLDNKADPVPANKVYAFDEAGRKTLVEHYNKEVTVA